MNRALPDQLTNIALEIQGLQFVLRNHELTPNERDTIADAVTVLYELGRRLTGATREARQ